MVLDPKKTLNLNLDILPFETRKALVFLSGKKWINQPHWYLAGGTGLSLLVGHRQSIDLDFFSTQKQLDNQNILSYFLSNKDWQTDINQENTIYGSLFKAKVSFIAYPFFVPKQEFVQYGAIKILQPVDIAVMKVIAISQRGRKRDFFDLYWCAKNLESLEKTVKRLPDQYPSVGHDYHHILKSLVYFEDAESDPEPKIYFQADWEKVKKFFAKTIPVIAEKLIIER